MSDRQKSIYEFHTNFLAMPAGSNYVMDCPFCGKEKHFFFHPESYQWDCKVCQKHGNPIEFIREFYDSLDTLTKAATDLSAERGLPFSAMSQARVKFNPLNGSYLIPTFKNGVLNNLYKVIRNLENKLIVMCSPNLYGQTLMDWVEDPKDTVWILEGHWDRITANAIITNHDITPIGVPGASTWKPAWCELLHNKDIVFIYDNDEAGRKGRELVITKYIANSHMKPKSISFVKWPEDKKKGYDLNDMYRDYGRGTFNRLQELIVSYEPPEDVVVTKVSSDTIEADTSVQTFEQLLERYKENYYTTPSVEMGLLLVLSAIYSVKVEGEQIWVRLIGPPSSGKTSIAKAMSGSSQVVLKSTFTGLFSGWKDKNDDSDASLVPLIAGKTLIIKDADALLRQKNVEQIFSELRDFYDKDSSTFYKNKVANDYRNIRSTIILCGTHVLRRSDQSFLGERFLDYELELNEEDRVFIEELMLKKSITMAIDPSGAPADTRIIAGGKGFVEHLMQRVPVTHLDSRSQYNIMTWARLSATMRTKVDREKYGTKEISSRPIVEVPARLIGQLTKLYMCATTVLGLQRPDDRVHALVAKVAKDIMDMTSPRMKMVRHMCGETYHSRDELLEITKMSYERCTLELADLIALDIVEGIKVQTNQVGRATMKWRVKRIYATDLQHIF